MTPSVILAIDTSSRRVGAAVADRAGNVIASAYYPDTGGRQAEVLPVCVEKLLKDANLRLRDIGRIAVATGPGAFTGVRAALAFAKGAGVCSELDVLGVSTLECLARQASAQHAGKTVAVLLSAGRGEVFLFVRDAHARVEVPACIMTLALAKVALGQAGPSWVLIGDGALIDDLGRLAFTSIHCTEVDCGALARFAAGLDASHYPAVPTYLREPDAKLRS